MILPPNSRPYFAYGSNMCRVQMAQRCPASLVLGVAILPGWRFAINRGGFATVIPAAATQVFGLVWALSAEDERCLDDYEGVAAGDYGKETIAFAEHGEALIYIAADATPGRPEAEYMGGILAAAAAADFPAAYRAELARWHAG